MNEDILRQCRSCKSGNLVEILSLGLVYLVDFVAQGEKVKPEKHPLDLVLCRGCSLVQLRQTTPPQALYTGRYGYKSGVSQTMRAELAGIAQAAERLVKLNRGDLVLDIGCNDGTLLKGYKTPGIIRVGFDPVAKFGKEFQGSQKRFINDYFSARSFINRFGKKKAKVVTAVAMFYDVDDPNRFVADLARILAPDGVMVIQQNYLVGMLEQTAFDNLVHEHLGYYSLLSLEPILRRHGLAIFDVAERQINGGSFRTLITHANSSMAISPSVAQLRRREVRLKLDQLATYQAFGRRVKERCVQVYRFIKGAVERGETVYVYGASTRGNTLLQACGLDQRLIKAAVERNPEKWGRKIASVEIPIISEAQARRDKPDYMLVLPWFFKEEFLEREKEYLKQGGRFIFPLPKLEIRHAA